MTHSVLVVDDDPGMVRTLCDILRLRGWDSKGVHSGEEAVKASEDQPYSFVLMDIMMPGIDGVAALKAMKLVRPEARVMLMTAHTAAEKVAEAEREGAMGVMIKPIDVPLLLQTIGS